MRADDTVGGRSGGSANMLELMKAATGWLFTDIKYDGHEPRSDSAPPMEVRFAGVGVLFSNESLRNGTVR
jgi:hypothetical protein